MIFDNPCRRPERREPRGRPSRSGTTPSETPAGVRATVNRTLRAALVPLLALCAIAAAGAGAGPEHWSRVRDAISKGLPKTALESMDPIIAAAQDERAWPEAIRAVTLKIALEAGIQGNKPEEKITRLRAALEKAPPEMRPVMEAILADWYWQYFQQNRWRFTQRTATAAEPGDDFTTWDLPRLYAEIDRHFTAALAAEALLRRTPIADYDGLLERGNAPDAYRPTLYDFVAREALQFYGSGEQAGARPEDAFVLQADSPVFAPREAFARWAVAATDTASPILKGLRLHQELLRFHAAAGDSAAVIDADLWRLEFARAHAVGADRDARYAAALEHLIAHDAAHELSARALHALATLRNEQGDPAGARALAQRGLERFPESVGGRRCHNLVLGIEAKSLSVTASDNVWNAPAPTLEVTYRNLDRVYFRLVPYDFARLAQLGKLPGEYGLGDVDVADLLNELPSRRWSASVPPTPDYRVRTERLPVPSGLRAGSYYLLSSTRADFAEPQNTIGATAIWISDLAIVLRDGRPGGLEGFVLDAAGGAPVEDAEVRTWLRKVRYDGFEHGPVTRTDRNGMFRIADPERLTGLLVTKGARRLGHATGFHNFRHRARQPDDRTVFFTDRGLYRPGQPIRYKGLCVRVDTERDDYATLASRRVSVALVDPNGREVAKAEHTTNAHGSFSGTFTAPEDGLRGQMQLRAVSGPGGGASLRVEEYKRPKFMVTLEAPLVAPRLADRVELTGRALGYAGAPVDGAQVEWRVLRQVRYPDWWGWRFGHGARAAGAQAIARGSATTDAEGRFTVSFVALPDPSVPAEQEPTFHYTVTGDVTDGAGETRSAGRTVAVGYTALAASLSRAEWLESARAVDIAVRTTTLDGTGQAASGTLEVLRLIEPAGVTRDREAATDYEENAAGDIVRRARKHIAPGPPDAGNADPSGWAEGPVVAERAVRTDSLGQASVSLRLEPGHYRARFRTRDRFGKDVTAMAPLRVLDPGATRFPFRVRDLFVARDASVEPGGDFLALWGTGYAGARAFVEVECRGKLLQSFWTGTGQTQAAIRQRVSDEMRGGFTVRVTRVAENRAYLHERTVSVPWTDRVLNVRWERFVSKLQPGQRETWTAVVTGPRAARAAAEMVATLYDASLDAFAPFGWGGIHGFRTNQDQRRPRFGVRAAWLQPVRGHWTHAYRDGSLDYHALPWGLLWGDYTYGLSDLPDPSVSQEFGIPGPGPASGTSRLAGQVRDANGKPIAFANVIVLGTKRGAVTDERGRYVIAGLPPGPCNVRASGIGHRGVTRAVKLAAVKTTFLDFTLGGPTGVHQLEAITISSERRSDGRRPASAPAEASAHGFVGRELAMKSAIAEGDAMHFRGGRAEEAIVQGLTVADAPGLPAPAPNLDAVVARADLRETAFFFPHLLADANGEVRIEFTAPEALTEWRFMAFAHDNALRSGTLSGRAVTSKDLMVQPNPPRFLREGDELEFTVKVTNRAGEPQRGSVRLQFTHAADDSPADAALGNGSPELSLDVPARSSRTYAWRIRVPDGAGVLRYKAVAATATLSDGEEGWLPVLSRRVLVTESLPLPIRGPAVKAFDFERLLRSGDSPTLRHQSVTVQVVSNPAWYAVMALPYLIEYPYECSEQTFNRLYANTLARHIANSQPSIRETFDRWRGTPALDSPLEKNEQLKSVLVSETPWLRQAKAESQARRNVGILFERSRLDRETKRLVEKLDALQLPGGLWPWFPGGPPNEYITLYITTGFARLRHLGVDLPMDAAHRSLAALDAMADRWYRDILRRGNPKANHLNPTVALYLYGRSFFIADRPVPGAQREALDFWLNQARAHWLEVTDRQSRGHLALALLRFGDPTTARAIMRSVKEYSVTDEEMGTFWRDTERSWWWYRAPIETQALMIEAFDEVLADSATVEDCRVWLLKQKQTQDWKTTKATADAVYALLLRGTNMLATKSLVEVTLGDSLVRPVNAEAGTGFYEQRWGAGQVRPEMGRVKVAKRDAGVAWGSVHWQYLEDMDKVTAYTGTPLKLEKQLFVRKAGKAGLELHAVDGAVKVGDELVVRVVLRTDRDMEYVHLKDYRGSGVEPVNVLSTYKYQDGLRYYEETRDVASHFFIDYLPKGTYVFEYAVRVQHRGRYTSGTAGIQCMYAPEFNSHSGSVMLVVE